MLIAGGFQTLGRVPVVTDQHTRIAIQGQSNAIGVGDPSELSTSPLSSDSGLATYYNNGFSRVYILNSGSYELMTKWNNLATTLAFGPEFGIAVRWERETSVSNLYIDKHTVDGGFIANFQEGTAFWTATEADLDAGDTWLANHSVSPVDGGWLWVQGESDHSGTNSTEANYTSQLNTLIASRVSAGRSMGMRVLAQINAESTGYGAGVVAAKAAVAAANSANTKTIDYTNHMNGDSLHLNAQGQVQLAYDAFEKLFAVQHIST